jgi:pimeloyl-ACP methyl ester carboxylesterase
MRILGWWVRDYAYAAVWQCRAVLNRTDPASFLGGDLAPIVVLPGIYETWKFMQPTIAALHERGHPVHVIDLLRRNSRPVVEMAERVSDYLEAHDLHDVVLVAHSKGGLVGKQAMAFGPSVPRIRAMLAVATPFGGSRYADLMFAPSLRLFSPHDKTILALALATEVNARIVSIYGEFDPHIPGGSELPGAKNVRLDTGGHFRVLADPRVMAELVVLAG